MKKRGALLAFTICVSVAGQELSEYPLCLFTVGFSVADVFGHERVRAALVDEG